MDFKQYHQPVLVNQLIDNYNISNYSIICDGTIGFAGHAEAILSRYSLCQYIGFDRDFDAIKLAKKRCSKYSNFKLIHAPYATMFRYFKENSICPTHILLDLGMSSYQIDQSNRGFTFQKNEPLDMRMDLSSPMTAAIVLNSYSKNKLIMLLSEYSDLYKCEKFVDNILDQRTKQGFKVTNDLKDCVKRSFYFKSRSHFISMLTKVFQAIRIEVNKELDQLNYFLSNVLSLKNVIVAIISFQPNEDRIVKSFIKDNNCQKITKKALMMSYHECKGNPRAKSAKLRIFKV